MISVSNFKVIQSDSNPIKVAYRFRTKGLQWIWINTKFQLTSQNPLINSKTYSIRGYSEAIGINEILSNKEILDSSSSKKSHGSSLTVENDLIVDKNESSTTRNVTQTSSSVLNEKNLVYMENDMYNNEIANKNIGVNSTAPTSKLEKTAFSDFKDTKQLAANFEANPSNSSIEQTLLASTLETDKNFDTQIDQSLRVCLFFFFLVIFS